MTDVSYENELIWTTKEGRGVAIKAMSDGHLRNVIFFLVGHRAVYRHELELTVDQPVPAWKYALILGVMLREADRRGLEWWSDDPNRK